MLKAYLTKYLAYHKQVAVKRGLVLQKIGIHDKCCDFMVLQQWDICPPTLCLNSNFHNGVAVLYATACLQLQVYN